MLVHFIEEHREELVERSRAKVGLRFAPRVTKDELTNGVPLFLTQLSEILSAEAANGAPDGSALGESAAEHGRDLFRRGYSIVQVVHDYGDVCQAITELALELNVPMETEDFRTLNRCLDDAIASAVTGFAQTRDVDASSEEARRHGFFAHELRNRLNSALLAVQIIKTGKVGFDGSTMKMLERSLRGLRELIDQSMSEVRVAAGVHHRELVDVGDFVEEIAIDASIEATSRGLQFTAESANGKGQVNVDRQSFSAALSNLLQNAFKFTRPRGHVRLGVRAVGGRLSIEVEDECGGLPTGAAETMFEPFEQLGVDRTGLGLGLTISRRAIEANGGEILLRDLPGKGCIFTIEMPIAVSG